MATVKVNNNIDPKALQKDLSFTENTVGESMVNHAGMFAHYATKFFEAETQLNKIKQIFEVTRSKVDSEVRKDAADEGRKLTEKLVEGEVSLDSRVIQAQRALNEAQTICTLAKHAVEAFRQRKDMLVQVASNRREEYKGAVRLGGSPVGQSNEAALGRIAGHMAERAS